MGLYRTIQGRRPEALSLYGRDLHSLCLKSTSISAKRCNVCRPVRARESSWTSGLHKVFLAFKHSGKTYRCHLLSSKIPQWSQNRWYAIGEAATPAGCLSHEIQVAFRNAFLDCIWDNHQSTTESLRRHLTLETQSTGLDWRYSRRIVL